LTSRVDGSTLFLLGEADAGDVDELAACLDRAPSLGDIDLDLAGLTFIDLTALRAILRFGSRLAACDRSLTVVNPSQPVALLLRISGFDHMLLGPGEAPGRSPLEHHQI
jgi:anti-anti-sigma factor